MSRATQDTLRIAPEVMARYEAVIGLEVHAQLKTQTKAFCACSTRFGDAPNSNTCPVCLGLPGALPVLNRRARELAVRASLALHCEIQERSVFARKNYFYPDLPKGYQISMYELPLALAGRLEVELEGAAKRIGITRLHMEEDAAKNLHEGFADSDRWSYIDYNRCGVPLIEIVSEPDIRSAPEAYSYLTTLKQVLEYTDVSDCNMEAGSLRCDANVSVRLRGAPKFGTKVEVKNLNSFGDLEDALEYEIERQIGVLESGGSVTQETRLWNVAGGRTEPMRSKEFAHDYRYFPDPDLLPVSVSEELIGEVRGAMPELPDAKRARFVRDHGITTYDSRVLAATRPLADYFEAAVRAGAPPKTAANWISTELLRWLKDPRKDISGENAPLPIAEFTKLLGKIDRGEITVANGKEVLGEAIETGRSVEEIVASRGLHRISSQEVSEIVEKVMVDLSARLVLIREGQIGPKKSFMGEAMKRGNRQIDPKILNQQLEEAFDMVRAQVVSALGMLTNASSTQGDASGTSIGNSSSSTSVLGVNVSVKTVSVNPELLRKAPRVEATQPEPEVDHNSISVWSVKSKE